jgi:hypothetical protein
MLWRARASVLPMMSSDCILPVHNWSQDHPDKLNQESTKPLKASE